MPTKKMTNKEKIEVLQKQVWKEVCEFMEKPEDMLEYLNFLQKFPQYSIHNRMLIHSQRPGAVAVASFKKFKEAGVKVRKGEKALRIFAPTSNKYFYRDNGEKREAGKKLSVQNESRTMNQILVHRPASYVHRKSFLI